MPDQWPVGPFRFRDGQFFWDGDEGLNEGVRQFPGSSTLDLIAARSVERDRGGGDVDVEVEVSGSAARIRVGYVRSMFGAMLALSAKTLPGS